MYYQNNTPVKRARHEWVRAPDIFLTVIRRHHTRVCVCVCDIIVIYYRLGMHDDDGTLYATDDRTMILFYHRREIA